MFRLAPRGVFADCQSLESDILLHKEAPMRSLCLVALSSFFVLTFRERLFDPLHRNDVVGVFIFDGAGPTVDFVDESVVKIF